MNAACIDEDIVVLIHVPSNADNPVVILSLSPPRGIASVTIPLPFFL
jgi:hypothetical protein